MDDGSGNFEGNKSSFRSDEIFREFRVVILFGIIKYVAFVLDNNIFH